jgi:hypothetical protein
MNGANLNNEGHEIRRYFRKESEYLKDKINELEMNSETRISDL